MNAVRKWVNAVRFIITNFYDLFFACICLPVLLSLIIFFLCSNGTGTVRRSIEIEATLPPSLFEMEPANVAAGNRSVHFSGFSVVIMTPAERMEDSRCIKWQGSSLLRLYFKVFHK